VFSEEAGARPRAQFPVMHFDRVYRG